MNIDNIIIEKYINEIGSTAFSLYCFVKYICNGKETRIKLIKIMETLNLSKPTAINTLKLLKKHELVSVDVKIEEGKKRLYLKDVFIGKKSLPLSTLNNINIISKRKNKYYILYKKIIKKILNHPRYNNKYYRNRKWLFDKKKEQYIKNLLDEDISIKNYINWFLEKKAAKISGFNLGLLCCLPMVEEYKILNKKSLIKKDTKKENKKISNIKIEQAKELVNDINGGKKLNKIDEAFLNECLLNKEIIKTQKGYELNARV